MNRRFINTMISPDGSIAVETNTLSPYQHSKWAMLPISRKGKGDFPQDIELHNRVFVHTNIQPEGTYILIHQAILI